MKRYVVIFSEKWSRFYIHETREPKYKCVNAYPGYIGVYNTEKLAKQTIREEILARIAGWESQLEEWK
jgi:hypothetical protein